MTALEKVALFLFRKGSKVEKIWIKLPVGSREALRVDDTDILCVHPKTYVSVYRKTGRMQHGMREALLAHYSRNGYVVAIFEEDSQTIAIAEATNMFGQSANWVFSGKFEGDAEKMRFTPRVVFNLFDFATGNPIQHQEGPLS